jgi:hypothetical protein
MLAALETILSTKARAHLAFYFYILHRILVNRIKADPVENKLHDSLPCI